MPQRFVRSVLALALLVGTPGLPAWAAVAKTVLPHAEIPAAPAVIPALAVPSAPLTATLPAVAVPQVPVLPARLGLERLEEALPAPEAREQAPERARPALDAAFEGSAPRPAASAAAPLPAYASPEAPAALPAAALAPGRAPAVATTVVKTAAPSRRLLKSFGRLPPERLRPPGAGARSRAAAVVTLAASPTGDGRIARIAPGAAFRTAEAEGGLPGIAPETAADPLFKEALATLFASLPEEARRRGVRVGVHQMRAEDGEVVTEGLHQDGFADYVAVWSVARANATGGLSRLSEDRAGERQIFRRALEPGELLVFDNRRLWHDATPLSRRSGFAGPARRDVFVFAVSVLPEAKPLPPAERRAARAAIAAEFAKPAPDAARMRALFETGDPAVQQALYRGFKGWSRYLSPGGAEGPARWAFLKSAAAPWAGHVYVKQLKSFLEMLADALGEVDAQAKATEIHQADHEFSKAFAQAAEDAHPQGMDADETADAVSDSALYAAVIQPVLERRQKGPFDRAALKDELAQRLKDTVYLYTPMTKAQIGEVLAQRGVGAKLDHFLDLVEGVIPPDRTPPTPGGGRERSRPWLSGKGAAGRVASLALFFAASALVRHFFGEEAAGLVLAFGGLAASDGGRGRDDRRGEGPEEPQGPIEPAAFLKDLTAAARRGELGPIYLRDDEIAKTIRILNQGSHNNAIMIGEPGVGKTAIAEGVAQRVALGLTGSPIDGSRVLLLDIGKFMAQASGSPDRFAAAVEAVIAEVADGKTLLVIDEAHMLARDPSVPIQAFGSFFDQIKTVMTQGRLKLILATTRDEYNKFFATDRAIESRSTILYIDPVPVEPAIELLHRIRGQYEHGIEATFEAARAAVELTVRAFRFEALLRMAIKAFDAAATRLRLRSAHLRGRLLETRRDLLYYLDLLRQARAEGDLERQEALVRQLDALLGRYLDYQRESMLPRRTRLTRDDVAEALKEQGAPVHVLSQDTGKYLAEVEARLSGGLIGHDTLVKETLEALKNRFSDPNSRKPVFSSLLLGPTGTGKTEFVRLLAKALMGIDDIDKGAIKINGGEYQDKWDLARIQGSPPGYVGFGQTETLMDKVRRKPDSIILVDEAEKLHPSIMKLFLSILEDGTATDSYGRPVDFSHTVVVFTSNFGVPQDYETMEDADFVARVRAALKGPESSFSPELLNRFDLTDVFTSLKEDEVRRIIRLRLEDLRARWRREHGVAVELEDEEGTVAAVMAEGYSRRNNAREVNRVVKRRLSGLLSNLLVGGQLSRGDSIRVAPDWSHTVSQGRTDARRPVLSGGGEEGRALASRLEALLGAEGGGAPLTLPDLDRALDQALRLPESPRLAARTALEGYEPQGRSEPLKRHAPNQADPELKTALAALKEALAARAGFDPEPALAAAKVLVVKAKRLGLEAELARREGPLWERGFAELEREAADLVGEKKARAQEALAAAVEAAGRDREVRLSWELGEARARVAVEADSRLTYEEEERLLATLVSPEGPAAKENAGEGPFVQALKDLEAAGGRLGYARESERTVFWLEWTLPAAPAKPAPAPEPEVPAETPAAEAAAPAAAEPPAAAAPASAKSAASEWRTIRDLINRVTDGEGAGDATEAGKALIAVFEAHPELIDGREFNRVVDALLEVARRGDPPAAADAARLAALQEVLLVVLRLKTDQPDFDRASDMVERLPADGALAAALLDRLEARARELGAEGVLKELGVRDELGVWRPGKARERAYERLAARWPELAAEAKRGNPPDADSSRRALELAKALLNPSGKDDAMVEAANGLARLLSEKPEAASAPLERLLWAGIEAHAKYLKDRNDNNRAIEESTRVLLGGTFVPVRRVREAFGLYRRVVEARPDLVPPEIGERLSTLLALPKVLEYRYGEGESVDQAGTAVSVWTLKQGADLALAARKSRPDLVGHKALLGYHRSLVDRMGEPYSVEFLGGLAYFLAIVGVGLGVPGSLWWGWAVVGPALAGVGAALAALRLAYTRRRHARLNEPLGRAAESLSARHRESLKDVPMTEVLDAVGLFDAEREAWSPRKEHRAAFKDLLKVLPGFRAAVEGSVLGTTPVEPGAPADLAARFNEVLPSPFPALNASLQLRDALAAGRASTPEVEAELRKGLDAFLSEMEGRYVQQDGYRDYWKWNDSFYATYPKAQGTSYAALRRMRELIDRYEELFRAEPGLLLPALRVSLSRGFTLHWHGQERDSGVGLVSWLHERLSLLVERATKAKPDFFSHGDLLYYYDAAKVVQPYRFKGFRAQGIADRWGSLAIFPLVVAGLFTGGIAIWGWAAWAGAVTAGMGAVAFASYLRWRWLNRGAKARAAAVERRLGDAFAAQAKGQTPREILDLIAEYDGEREEWFPKPGHHLLFGRLTARWPEFLAATKTR